MLIGFSIGNYKSFKDIVTFSMVASPITSEDKKVDENNVFEVNEQLKLLKSAAIYGANASGKSNFVAAINFMRSFVLNSSKEGQISEPIDVEPFRLSTQTEKEPSFFEIVFRLDRKIYRYGFEVDTKEVISEWLFYRQKTKEFKLFERELDNFQLTTAFKEGKGITNKTRNNALFLSVVAQFNGETAKKILMWFRGLNVISGLDDLGYRDYTIHSFEDNHHKDAILRLVKKLDLGIDDIQIEKIPITEALLPKILPEELRNLILRSHEAEIKAIKTVHLKYNAEGQPNSIELFDVEDNESEGTKKLFYLAGPLIETLKTGEILLIDELDSRFHPLITCAIISLFNWLYQF
jgi:AAA15 family ATPase/GTPase